MYRSSLIVLMCSGLMILILVSCLTYETHLKKVKWVTVSPAAFGLHSSRDLQFMTAG